MVSDAYMFAFVLAACSALASVGYGSATRRLWVAIAAGLLILILLRTGHFALWLDNLLRGELTTNSWYPHRRPVQIAAIVTVFVVTAFTLCRFFPRESKLNRQVYWAATAFAALVAFAVIRSSSLHWTDAVIDRPFGSTSFGQIFQAVCLAVISFSAFSLLSRRLTNRK